MLSARDMLGAGQTGFGDHHLSLLIRAGGSTSWTAPWRRLARRSAT